MGNGKWMYGDITNAKIPGDTMHILRKRGSPVNSGKSPSCRKDRQVVLLRQSLQTSYMVDMLMGKEYGVNGLRIDFIGSECFRDPCRTDAGIDQKTHSVQLYIDGISLASTR